MNRLRPTQRGEKTDPCYLMFRYDYPDFTWCEAPCLTFEYRKLRVWSDHWTEVLTVLGFREVLSYCPGQLDGPQCSPVSRITFQTRSGRDTTAFITCEAALRGLPHEGIFRSVLENGIYRLHANHC